MNTEHFKQKLEDEMDTVNQELADLGHEDIDESATEADELADRMEEREENASEKAVLLARKKDIVGAMARIAAGTYGFCEECGEKIDEDRLEANPAAGTCSVHME